MYKLNIQLFATGDTTSQLGSAVVGHRMWMGTTIVPTIDNPILGVRSTPDLGSAQNTVEANVISSIREENVPGLFPASDIEFTLLFNKSILTNQLSMINKEVWVYEERENMTSTPDKFGLGILYKIKVSGITVTGQSPEGLQECTQSATLVSDEFYLAIPTYGEGTEPTWTYQGLQTGKTVTADVLNGVASASTMSLRSSETQSDSTLKK